MTSQTLLRCMFSLSFFISVTASAAGSATEMLNAFVRNTITYKAHFSQTVVGPKGAVMEKASGEFLLERPGKFRWDYQAPYQQQIVADGQHIWFYDVDLEQITVKSQLEVLAQTPATLLSGNSLPKDNYLINDLPSKEGLAWVELIPKNVDSNYQTVRLAFDKAGLRQMVMKDSFDQLTRLEFSDAQINPHIDEKTFKFVPPAGVDVIGETYK